MKRWELLEENNNAVNRHFSGATTTDVKAFIKPTVSNNLEKIVLHYGANNLRKNITADEIGNKILKEAESFELGSDNNLASGFEK